MMQPAARRLDRNVVWSELHTPPKLSIAVPCWKHESHLLDRNSQADHTGEILIHAQESEITYVDCRDLGAVASPFSQHAVGADPCQAIAQVNRIVELAARMRCEHVPSPIRVSATPLNTARRGRWNSWPESVRAVYAVSEVRGRNHAIP